MSKGDLGPWERQLTGPRRPHVALIPGARHFMMIDAPDVVYREIESLLTTADARP